MFHDTKYGAFVESVRFGIERVKEYGEQNSKGNFPYLYTSTMFVCEFRIVRPSEYSDKNVYVETLIVEYTVGEVLYGVPTVYFSNNILSKVYLWQTENAQGHTENDTEIPLNSVVITLMPLSFEGKIQAPYYIGGSGERALCYIAQGSEKGVDYFKPKVDIPFLEAYKQVEIQAVTEPIIEEPAIVELDQAAFDCHFGKAEQYPSPYLDFVYIAEFDGELASDIKEFCSKFGECERSEFTTVEFQSWQRLNNRLFRLNEKIKEGSGTTTTF